MLDEIIQIIEEELERREPYYQTLVETGQLTQQKAHMKLAVLRNAINEMRKIKDFRGSEDDAWRLIGDIKYA